MRLFDDDMFNDLGDQDEYVVSAILLSLYKDILGERISEKINEFTIEMKDEDERLFDVLRRELSEWLVCNGLATNDIKFEVDNDNTPVYESGICRYGQYNPSEKKITLFIKNIPNDVFEEIRASTILHELMHAYFDCGLSRKPNLELIEEPLAEAGMLDFYIIATAGHLIMFYRGLLKRKILHALHIMGWEHTFICNQKKKLVHCMSYTIRYFTNVEILT